MIWQIINKIAYIEHPSWIGEFDLRNPERGLRINFRGSKKAHVNTELSESASAFKISVPESQRGFTLGEFYVRGEDLIVQYPSDSYRNFNIQLDFRLMEIQNEFFGIELWISVQTHLLDTRPSISTGFGLFDVAHQTILAVVDHVLCDSANKACGPEHLQAGVIAAPMNVDGHLSCAILIHPLDQRDVIWEFQKDRPEQYDLRWFGQSMEKGVIRRGRIQFFLSTKPITIERAQAQYGMFAESPMPLSV